MRLRDLEARFVRWDKSDDGRITLPFADSIQDAHGVIFVCPKCFNDLGGRVGAHSCICWFVGRVPQDAEPGPGRWNPSGSGIDDLTFIGPGLTSVLLTGGCGWHGFIQNGEVTLQ